MSGSHFLLVVAIFASGVFHQLCCEEIPADITKGVKFHLWTRANPEQQETLVFDESFLPENLQESAFNSSAKTKVFIHGYLNSGTRRYILEMKDAYLQTDDVNFLSVDWGPRALGISYLVYSNAVAKVTPVGEHVANFLTFLVEYSNTSIENFHVIGHSLGAHVAGCAGHKLNGSLSRITGLDPAKPRMAEKDIEYKLDVTDAIFVDVIHTCGGTVGIADRVGHIDFYPNGGVSTQPGCRWMGPCSHRRAYVYFIETIVSPTGFLARKCQSWSAYQTDTCLSGDESYMGTPGTNDRGSYYLATNSEPPYGKTSTQAAPRRDSIFKKVMKYFS